MITMAASLSYMSWNTAIHPNGELWLRMSVHISELSLYPSYIPQSGDRTYHPKHNCCGDLRDAGSKLRD